MTGADVNRCVSTSTGAISAAYGLHATRVVQDNRPGPGLATSTVRVFSGPKLFLVLVI